MVEARPFRTFDGAMNIPLTDTVPTGLVSRGLYRYVLQKKNRREARLASRRTKSYVLNASLERDRPNVQSVAESVARLIVDVLNVGPLQQDIELSDALQHLRNRLTVA